MSIPIKTTTAVPLTANRPAQLAVTIHRTRLASFLQSDRRIGPLTCQEWSAELTDHFSILSRHPENHDLRRLFPKLADIFLVRSLAVGQFRAVDDGLRYGVQLQFRSQFPDRLAGKLGLSFAQLLVPSTVFMELMALSVKLEHLTNDAKAVSDAVKVANRILARMSEKHPVKYVID